MPNYAICCKQDVDQIGEEVLLMCSRGILVAKSSRYLFAGKFSGNVVVGVWITVEGVEGSDEVSGSCTDVSNDRSIGSFNEFGSF